MRVREALGKRMIHNPHYRVVNLNQICPNRSVRITPEHLQTLMAKRRRGEITEQQLRDWALSIFSLKVATRRALEAARCERSTGSDADYFTEPAPAA